MKEIVPVLKHPALFAGSLMVMVVALLLGVYYALPGVYHISLGHSHPPLQPKLDYAAAFLILAIICAVVAWISRLVSKRG